MGQRAGRLLAEGWSRGHVGPPLSVGRARARVCAWEASVWRGHWGRTGSGSHVSHGSGRLKAVAGSRSRLRTLGLGPELVPTGSD